EYRPHCDGGCGYEEVQLGMRVASSLLYCNVADQGGSTIFTKDATKFTPRRGDFLFFVYKSDPSFMSMHAACPVLRGVKSTATQWYREGVRKGWTWEDVNDLGYSRSDSKEL
ncbi:dpy-18, partial [Symbiodinium necroappetens]